MLAPASAPVSAPRLLSTYTVLVAVLIQGLMHSLVSSYVFAIHKTQTAHGWSDGTGFGALLLFCGFYLGTALLVPRWPPKTCMRLGTYVFVVFAAFSLIPVDPTIFIISFALLGFVAMAQSVLLSWWGKKQLDRTPVVVARMSMISVAANVPLAIYGALLNARDVDFQLAFAVSGLVTGVLTVVALQRCVEHRVFRQEIVDSTCAVSQYVSDPLSTYLAYDDDHDVLVTLPRFNPRAPRSVELSDLRRGGGGGVTKSATAFAQRISEQQRHELELQLDEVKETDTESEIDVPSQVASSSAGTASSSGSAEPVNRPTFAEPSTEHAQQLRLWLGLWTWAVTFTTEALMYYNVAGFSRSYDTPWYVIAVVITAYTALIVGALFVFTRVGNSLRHVRFLWWYRWTWYMLLLAALLHAVLMMTSLGTNYVWHSALSVMYMIPLTVVSTMPMSRAQELCQRHGYTLHGLLPMWTTSVASARAAAYLAEYIVLYFDRQLSMMFVLAAFNAQVYFTLRRAALYRAVDTAETTEPAADNGDDNDDADDGRDAAKDPTQSAAAGAS